MEPTIIPRGKPSLTEIGAAILTLEKVEAFRPGWRQIVTGYDSLPTVIALLKGIHDKHGIAQIVE
jgi:hypothetical protein